MHSLLGADDGSLSGLSSSTAKRQRWRAPSPSWHTITRRAMFKCTTSRMLQLLTLGTWVHFSFYISHLCINRSIRLRCCSAIHSLCYECRHPSRKNSSRMWRRPKMRCRMSTSACTRPWRTPPSRSCDACCPSPALSSPGTTPTTTPWPTKLQVVVLRSLVCERSRLSFTPKRTWDIVVWLHISPLLQAMMNANWNLKFTAYLFC